MEKIIFARYKFNILIKHEALIRAIDLGYNDIVSEIGLNSADHDLVKTALSQINDDDILANIALGKNSSIPPAKQSGIQKLALQRINNDLVFFKTGIIIMDQISLYNVFQKLKKKATLRGIPKFFIRLIPVIMHTLQTNEVRDEFSNLTKYSEEIINKFDDLTIQVNQYNAM